MTDVFIPDGGGGSVGGLDRGAALGPLRGAASNVGRHRSPSTVLMDVDPRESAVVGTVGIDVPFRGAFEGKVGAGG